MVRMSCRRQPKKVELEHERRFLKGEQEAEHISWLIGYAIEGHRGYTEELWRALASDTSDCHDEGRWLRVIARTVVSRILDGDTISIEERGRIALDALGLGNGTDPLWRLKQDIANLSMFDDLIEGTVSRTPTQIVRMLRDRGHFGGRSGRNKSSDRNAAKVVTRILRSAKK